MSRETHGEPSNREAPAVDYHNYCAPSCTTERYRMTVSGWFATRAPRPCKTEIAGRFSVFPTAQLVLSHGHSWNWTGWLVYEHKYLLLFFLEFRHNFFLSISGVHLSSTWKVNILPRANVQKQRKQYILGKYATYATILYKLRQSLQWVRLFFKFNPDKKNHRWWLGGVGGGLRSCDNRDKQQNGCLLFANSVHDVLRKTGGYLPNIGSHTAKSSVNASVYYWRGAKTTTWSLAVSRSGSDDIVQWWRQIVKCL